MSAPLPLAATELLATKIEPRQFPTGTVIMREGEAGHHFHLIVEGPPRAACADLDWRDRVWRRGERVHGLLAGSGAQVVRGCLCG
jgi:hypothetical protein